MTSCAFVIPGDIDLPTGGYAYDRRVLALLGAHGVETRHVALPGSFPAPTEDDLAETRRILYALPRDAVLLFDGLAYGAMPEAILRPLPQPIVALCHHPLALEAGLDAGRAKALYQSEMTALSLARHVVVTSAATGRTLARDFAVASTNVTVAEPGTQRATRATGTGNPLQLLAVGSIVPRKAYDVLASALALLPANLDWHLTIVGAIRDHGARTALDVALSSIPASRIAILGAVDDAALARLYAAADVFVMPSLYEGFGMVLTEAMARGLPIVCTTGGAAADTAPNTAAIKVPPGDTPALAKALTQVIGDASLRLRMANAAWTHAQTLATWDDTARIIASVLKKVRA